ncbi:MAG: FAD-dependent oxidoreductase [Kiloniellaceae bacterium]|nr:FAD-dependent oxidoreductase [Kiloniellaceae bacterium]
MQEFPSEGLVGREANVDLPGKDGCCWTATAPETSYPALSGKQRVEVAIVGGGIAGLSAALPLAEAGCSVAVLEALRVGRQVTGRSTAKVTTQHALIYDHLIETLGRETAALYAEANKAGMARILDWIDAHGIDCDLERKSAYVYIDPERDRLEDLNRETEAALSFGLPADVVDRAPLPFATGGAVRFTEQAQFNPARYLIGLAGAVAAAGGTLYESSRIVALEQSGRWTLSTGSAEVEADHVLLTTNLPIGGPDDYSQRTQPRYHVAMAFRIDPAKAPDGMFIAAEDPVHSFRQARDQEGDLLLVLGPRFSTGQEGDVASHFRELEQWTRIRFEVGAAAWRWANEDYDTASRIPFVGEPFAEAKGLHIATGFNGWGITNGTAAGLLLADEVLARPNPWSALYTPDRKSPDDFHQSGKTQSKVASIDEIPRGSGGVIEKGEEKLAVWRDDDGAMHAFSATCPHKGCTVTWNNAVSTWDCPCHGSIFAAGGSVLHGPAVKPLEPRRLPS